MRTYRHWQWLLIPGVVAGVLYNSWIAGYWLNPMVARHGLASELEALHQPYNWLFTGADILCSVIIIGLAYRLWRRGLSRLQKAILINYAAFALFTIVDAILPMHCDPSLKRCPDAFHDPMLVAHGVCSILASLGLFLAVVFSWWRAKREVLLQALIIGYILFGVFSLISLLTPGEDSWAQHYTLLLDGVCIVTVPLIIGAPSRRKSSVPAAGRAGR